MRRLRKILTGLTLFLLVGWIGHLKTSLANEAIPLLWPFIVVHAVNKREKS